MFCCILGFFCSGWGKERETEDNYSRAERGIKQISQPPPTPLPYFSYNREKSKLKCSTLEAKK